MVEWLKDRQRDRQREKGGIYATPAVSVTDDDARLSHPPIHLQLLMFMEGTQ